MVIIEKWFAANSKNAVRTLISGDDTLISGDDQQIRKAFSRAQLQAERSTVAISLQGFENLLKRRLKSSCAFHAELAMDRWAQVGEDTGLIGRPETCDARILELLDDCELVRGRKLRRFYIHTLFYLGRRGSFAGFEEIGEGRRAHLVLPCQRIACRVTRKKWLGLT
ncbi:hypothetical protein LCM19_04890 [Qipengyuania flava]|nr:hypothetical protein [Qipengyuania flava]